MHDHSLNDTDGGFHQDLKIIESRLVARRRALALLGGGAGAAILGGTGSLLFPRSAAAGGKCVADAAETAGPYPADGTNHAQGPTSDVLTESGVVRRDIRKSFIGSKTKAPGVKVTMNLKLAGNKSGCAPLADYAVYIWQCDRDALYSLYTIPAESYLRGVQVADENGELSFITIFPACYPGRYPHMHLEIFSSLAQATNGHNATLTTQLALPGDVCEHVYNKAEGYSASINNFKNISLQTDSVFHDDTKAQLKAMTPVMSGNIAHGYSGTATVGVLV